MFILFQYFSKPVKLRDQQIYCRLKNQTLKLQGCIRTHVIACYTREWQGYVKITVLIALYFLKLKVKQLFARPRCKWDGNTKLYTSRISSEDLNL